MLDRGYFAQLQQEHGAYLAARREVMKLAGDALNAAKRAIFALHRDDATAADALFAEAEDKFAVIRKLIDEQPELVHEGSYRAALEEYAEAALYRQFLADGSVGKIDMAHVGRVMYLGGLADLTGELQRRQVRAATEGNVKEVQRLKDAIEAIIVELLAMDLEGYLRTKSDQAKNSLRRAEDVLYEVTLRRA